MPHFPVMKNPATSADWVRLCTLLDDDPHLAPTVHLAVVDPQTYLDQRAAAPVLAGPELSGVGPVDPWQALLDGLDDAGALAYLDAQDSGMELVEALTPLPRVVRAGADLEELTDLESELAGVIGAAGRLLAPYGLQIVQLEEDADSCPLVVVEAEHVPAILELVARLGHGARTFP